MKNCINFIVGIFSISMLYGSGQPQQPTSPLTRIYEKLGGMSNYTTPGGFEDQAAGHYTGGGLALRQSSTTVQPIQVSLPKMSVGCNNLDLYFGSLSFIKGEQLARLGKEVLTGAPTYALQLALKTSAPQIEGLLSEIRERVLAMNELMQNSCQMSQQLVGGVWPKNTAASEQICQDTERGSNHDFFGARKHCQKDSDVQSKVNAIREKYPDLLMGEYNLTWYVMGKMETYKESIDLKEFIMSLVGTLISVKDGHQFRLQTLAPKADSMEFLTAYLKGGATSQLHCDENVKCLSPKLIPHSIEEGLKEKISKHISSLRQKYIARQEITPEELAFLSDSVTVPVYKYIQVSAASGSQFLTLDATEYIAVSVLLYQFESIMSEIIDAIDLIAKVQLDDSAITHFRQQVVRARYHISQLQNTATMQARWMLDQAIKAEEQVIIARGLS